MFVTQLITFLQANIFHKLRNLIYTAFYSLQFPDEAPILARDVQELMDQSERKDKAKDVGSESARQVMDISIKIPAHEKALANKYKYKFYSCPTGPTLSLKMP